MPTKPQLEWLANDNETRWNDLNVEQTIIVQLTAGWSSCWAGGGGSGGRARPFTALTLFECCVGPAGYLLLRRRRNWVELFKALGAKSAVLTAQHGCGFFFWNTTVKLPDGSTYRYRM